MAVWAVKKRNENNEKLMKRFKKQAQSARMMIFVRIHRFHEKKKTKKRVREEAICRYDYRQIRAKERLYS